jgi:hypothetical protein
VAPAAEGMRDGLLSDYARLAKENVEIRLAAAGGQRDRLGARGMPSGESWTAFGMPATKQTRSCGAGRRRLLSCNRSRWTQGQRTTDRSRPARDKCRAFEIRVTGQRRSRGGGSRASQMPLSHPPSADPPPLLLFSSRLCPPLFCVDCCVAGTAAAFVVNGPSCASHLAGCCVASIHADASRPRAPPPLIAPPPLVAPLSCLLPGWLLHLLTPPPPLTPPRGKSDDRPSTPREVEGRVSGSRPESRRVRPVSSWAYLIDTPASTTRSIARGTNAALWPSKLVGSVAPGPGRIAGWRR